MNQMKFFPIQDHTRHLAKCFLATATLTLALHAAADYWPQFRGPNRNGKATSDAELLREWPDDGPRKMWTYEQLGFGFSSASVTDRAVYLTGMEDDEGFIYALDLDGNLQWKSSYGRDWDRGHRGSRTTPTYSNGKLYVISGYGKAACYDAENGERIWAVDTLEKFDSPNISWGITESPLVMDDKVIFSPGGSNGGIVALEPETGETIWVCEDVNDRSGYCSPFVINRGGKKIIVQLMATTFIGIEAENGRLLWREKRDPAPSHGIQAVAPVYDHDRGLFYVTSGYGGRRGQMFKLSEDATSLTRDWSDSELDCQHGGLVLVNGFIYGAADRNNRNQWLCMNLENGEVMDKINGVGKGSVIYVDGLLYTYGEKGEMGMVNPDPDDFRMISSFEMKKGNGPHWAHPSIADGRLYLRRGNALAVYDIQAE